MLPPKWHIHLDDRYNGHFNVLPGFVGPIARAGRQDLGHGVVGQQAERDVDEVLMADAVGLQARGHDLVVHPAVVRLGLAFDQAGEHGLGLGVAGLQPDRVVECAQRLRPAPHPGKHARREEGRFCRAGLEPHRALQVGKRRVGLAPPGRRLGERQQVHELGRGAGRWRLRLPRRDAGVGQQGVAGPGGRLRRALRRGARGPALGHALGVVTLRPARVCTYLAIEAFSIAFQSTPTPSPALGGACTKPSASARMGSCEPYSNAS